MPYVNNFSASSNRDRNFLQEDDNDWEKDEQFHRLYKLTQRLIEEGEASLKFQYKNLGRVISQYSGKPHCSTKQITEANNT